MGTLQKDAMIMAAGTFLGFTGAGGGSAAVDAPVRCAHILDTAVIAAVSIFVFNAVWITDWCV